MECLPGNVLKFLMAAPHPVRGLMEVKRVCKAGGKVVLQEHVLSENPAAAWLMNLLNFLCFWLVEGQHQP
jgi:hypothetical protein